MPTLATQYGIVEVFETGVIVKADGKQLRDWAHRPGAHWPCSVLAELDGIIAGFDTNGLVDLDQTPTHEEVSADEFNAWSSDVLREALPADHPCYFVCVGQF